MREIWKSLSPRVTMEIQPKEDSFIKAWSIMLPVLIYYLIDTILVKTGAIIVKYTVENIAQDKVGFFTDNSQWISLTIKIIAMLVAMAVIMIIFFKENPVITDKTADCRRYIVCVLLGMCAAVSINVIFNLTGLTRISASYNEAASNQFSLPVIVGVLFYGMLTPLAEELLFRGIVYNRLRREYGLIMAVIISSMLFALYHMNIVQGIYAFIMGVLLVWVYERYGGFVYPYIIHASANIIIYVTTTTPLKNVVFSIYGCVVAMVIGVCTFVYMLKKA